MRTTIHIVLTILVALAVGCRSPELTHCPDLDCPGDKVCDGNGGCAFPEQLQVCAGRADSSDCTYTDRTGHMTPGQCTNQVCYPLGCGNGFATPDEKCDDGNNASGDGCAADCQSNETCGNGAVDTAAGEQCDDGNNVDGDGCQANCKQPRCGDSIKDVDLDEECDAGDANSTAPNAACRPNCQAPRCGDNVLDTALNEVCDDGNNQAGDGCSGDCRSTEKCGNSVVDALAGEVCDDGNLVSGDGCAGDCKSLEVCGNGVLDTSRGEVCDDSNTVSGDGCSSDCKSLEVCGNSIVDSVTEQCDLGNLNSNAPDSACRTTCKLPYCGDTIIDGMHGEACDNGLMNADAPNACRTNCQLPRCGDNIKDSGETCDDGNAISGDGCSANCGSLETCGNGIIDVAKGEQCDNGAANSNNPNATCRTDCQLRKCGDAVVDTTAGEICDAGALNSNSPNATCRPNCTPQRCGDGIFDDTKGEVCDDNNVVSGDGCSNDCKSLETCGNSIVDAVTGEQCDNGGSNANTPNTPCRTSCKLAKCGDAIIDNTLLGEGCDAGAANSNLPNSACRTNCQPKRCGDGITDTGETCDDGNTTSGDGCSADCKSTEGCGNGIIDSAKGEQCDAGANNANTANAPCRADCKLPRCGDAIIDNVTLSEVCDLGGANSNLPNASCRTNCLPQRCGDTITDNTKSEVCDDGNLVNGDGCSADCKSNESCGNGIIDVSKNEQCDNGGLNADSPNATCRTTCLRQRCGDSIVDNAFGEGCDAGGANSNNPDAVCRTNCTPRRCGDGIKDTAAGEVCDDANNTNGDGCSSDCKSLETCGNGVVDTIRGEQCDAGGANSNSPNAPCRSDCKFPRCGDGVVDNLKGEACDAGAANSNVANAPCRPTCVLPACGDGVLDNLRGELCDDNNNVSNDGCRSDCASDESCGNGVLDTHKGEACDDGNTRGYDGCSSCQPETAVVLFPNSTPGARYLPALAYDAARQRVVMFGGKDGNGTIFNDTWEWDGISWTLLNPVHAPSARFDASVAYDAKRHRVIMFGGTSVVSGASTADTWEWDGVDWTQRTPTTVPSGRTGAAMAYDVNRKTLILFGGTNGSTTNQETWEWTGSNWSLLSPTTKPSARAGARMATDAINKYIVMYGGSADTATYTWNGTNWTSMGATAGPTTGYAANGMAFDAERGKVVLWGGVANSTYTWSGASWTLVSAATPTSPRTNITMTYDAARKQVVLFGGLNGTTAYDDTWLRDTTWAQPAAFVKPPARFRGSPGYDPIRRRLVLVSGQRDTRRFNGTDPIQLQDVWEWDGRKWVTGATTNQPSARAGARVVYDSNSRVMRVFGGDYVKVTNPGQADSWYTDVFSYTGTTWTNNSTTGREAVFMNQAVWDSSANKLVTFGGLLYINGTFTPRNTVWTWSPTTGWANPSPSGTLPPDMRNFGMAYDPIRKRSVSFGNFKSQTYEYDATANAWTTLTPSASPAPRYGNSLFFNPDSGRVAAFGSSSLADAEDLWEWNGTTWSQITVVGALVPTYQRAVGYDAANHAIVAFGGRDTSLTNFNAVDTFALVKNRPNGSVEACVDSQVDYDNDGKAGCADEECWPYCDPLKSPGTTRPAGAPYCGDGTCNGTEDCMTCPSECGTCAGKCGDFHCGSGETAATCPNDC